MNNYDITVITTTIGRRSLLKLQESLSKQKVCVLHILLWDKKRCNDALEPMDSVLKQYENKNYKVYNYVVEHPIQNIKRIDNYMRCVGIAMSSTDYITLIDDDCWIEQNWLSNAINLINTYELDYCFGVRYLWENENIRLGKDDYESIGEVNKFGYNLMEGLVFTKEIAPQISFITAKNNNYGHDRKIAKELIINYKGRYHIDIGLHQIVPDFLLNFHKRNIKTI